MSVNWPLRKLKAIQLLNFYEHVKELKQGEALRSTHLPAIEPVHIAWAKRHALPLLPDGEPSFPSSWISNAGGAWTKAIQNFSAWAEEDGQRKVTKEDDKKKVTEGEPAGTNAKTNAKTHAKGDAKGHGEAPAGKTAAEAAKANSKTGAKGEASASTRQHEQETLKKPGSNTASSSSPAVREPLVINHTPNAAASTSDANAVSKKPLAVGAFPPMEKDISSAVVFNTALEPISKKITTVLPAPPVLAKGKGRTPAVTLSSSTASTTPAQTGVGSASTFSLSTTTTRAPRAPMVSQTTTPTPTTTSLGGSFAPGLITSLLSNLGVGSLGTQPAANVNVNANPAATTTRTAAVGSRDQGRGRDRGGQSLVNNGPGPSAGPNPRPARRYTSTSRNENIPDAWYAWYREFHRREVHAKRKYM